MSAEDIKAIQEALKRIEEKCDIRIENIKENFKMIFDEIKLDVNNVGKIARQNRADIQILKAAAGNTALKIWLAIGRYVALPVIVGVIVYFITK